MDIIKCMCNGELYGYFPVSFISCECRLPIGKLVEIENSHKGDVIHYLHDSFENIGDIDEILKKNAFLRESRLRIWRKLTQRNYDNGKLSRELEAQKQANSELANEREALKAEVERLKYNLSVLSSALHGVILFTEELNVDDDGVITSAETGEVLSE